MTNETPLAGSAALITGASSGIGRAAAEALARDGADVALAARREKRLAELAEEIEADTDVETLVRPTDVTDEDAVERSVAATAETFGGLDVVVSNAGTNRFADVEDMTTEQYRAITSVNVDGHFYVSRAVIPYLRESRGNLIFVGSFAGKYPIANQPVYAASKWWTEGFALSLAGQIGDDDIAVTVVNPSEVRTEIGIAEDRPAHERYADMDAPESADIASAIAFAARQDPPNAVAELNYYRRDKFSEY